jgi:hypothetical protein
VLGEPFHYAYVILVISSLGHRPESSENNGCASRESRIDFTLAESARMMPVIASTFAHKSARNRPISREPVTARLEVLVSNHHVGTATEAGPIVGLIGTT